MRRLAAPPLDSACAAHRAVSPAAALGAAALTCCALLCGCGLRGPLYLPPKGHVVAPPPASGTATAPAAPAAPAASPATAPPQGSPPEPQSTPAPAPDGASAQPKKKSQGGDESDAGKDDGQPPAASPQHP